MEPSQLYRKYSCVGRFQRNTLSQYQSRICTGLLLKLVHCPEVYLESHHIFLVTGHS
ncbi:unknown [Salmonella phage FelixO1]|uniref:Uncharacterized protein n=1 Tax=Salmonella phage Felix O1 (isolate Felix O1-VT1) TaxID=1283336 RepID=Q6KG91_BPFO1|nr:unknown [Salmonella phage FelixO1]